MRMLAILIAGTLLSAGVANVRAQEGSEGAAAFVEGVFAGYSNDDADGRWPMAEANLDAVWSPRTRALIRRDRELATEEPPYLDADPLCDCQDWQDLRVLDAHFYRVNGARRVVVRFTNMGHVSTVEVQLYGQPGRWRIDDVINPNGGPGLVETLAESNRRIEQGGRAAGRD